MSYRSLAAKPLNASLKTLLKRSGYIGVGLGAFAPVLALANPTGGQVIAGQATIANPSASGMVITQKSQSAIINWQQFNIGAGQYVQFLQPSSSSVVLNRVIGGSASSILGNLTGNGQVFLVNTNGVYFGKGSSIDTQGFLASTLGISDQNFLAHNYVFDEAGTPGATVVNQGNITAHHSGYVVLAGDYAENDGVIAAQSGHVILASGSKATLSLNGNSLINFAVNQSTFADYAGVKNTGSILADGGTVIMTADVANRLKSTVVNNTGLVEAQAISNSGGIIQLLATGGNIQNAGTLDVSGTRAGQAGGAITLKGDERTMLTDTSNIDATGEGAKGGSVEVSGNTLSMRGLMNIGKGGRLLLDPESIEIIAGSIGTAGTAGTGQGVSAGGGLTKLGVKFIEGQLDSGASVMISAHALISASANVHAITSTPKSGFDPILGFNTSHGQIKLGGVDITVAGALQAFMGKGSFGHLQASNIDLQASSSIRLAGVVRNKNGAITTYSLKSTGDMTIAANSLHITGSAGTLGLSAAGKLKLQSGSHGDIDVSGVSKLLLKGDSVQAAQSMELHSGALSIDAGSQGVQLGHVHAGGVNIAADGDVVTGGIDAGGGNVTVVGDNITVGGDVIGKDVTLTALGSTLALSFFNSSASASSLGKITATGNVKLSAFRSIEVGDITAKGNIALVGGAPSLATMTYGNLKASSGSITIVEDSGGVASLHGGALSAAKNIDVPDAISMDISQIKAGGTVTVSGVVQLKIGSADVAISGDEGVILKTLFFANAGGTIDVNAPHGDIDVVDGEAFGGPSKIDAAVALSAGGDIVFTSGGILTTGDVTLHAQEIVSKGLSFSISAGKLVLDAPIGSAKAPVKGNVSINAVDSALLIGHSIYAVDGIFITETGRVGGTSTHAGVYIGNSDGTPITLSAKGPITLTGPRVAVGFTGHMSGGLVAGDAPISISADDGNAKTETDTLTLQGTDDSAGFGVFVAAAGGSTTYGAGGKLSVDHSVNLHAGADLVMTGYSIELSGGDYAAKVDGLGGSVSVDEKLSLSAGRDMSIEAAHGLIINGGLARGTVGSAQSGTKETVTVTGGLSLAAGRNIFMSGSALTIVGGDASGQGSVGSATTKTNKVIVDVVAGVSLTAGGNVSLTGANSVTLAAGFAHADAVADQAKGNVAVTALSDVSVTAGGNIHVTGAIAGLAGGGDGQSGSSLTTIVTSGSAAKATAAVHADLSMTAGGSMDFIDTSTLTLRGGNGVGGLAQSSFDNSPGSRGRSARAAIVEAEGKGATAAYTTTGMLNLSAGAGGIAIQTGALTVQGGNSVGAVMFVSAGGTQKAAKATATADVEAGVSIVSKGAIAVTATQLTVAGGKNAAGIGLDSLHRASHGINESFTVFTSDEATGASDAVSMEVGAGVQIKAAGNITLDGGTAAYSIHGGDSAGDDLHGLAASHAVASKISTSVDVGVGIAGGGAVTVHGDRVSLHGGDDVLQNAGITAGAGTVSMTDTAVVAVTGKSLGITGTSAGSHALKIVAGSQAAVQFRITATDGAKLGVAAAAGVALTATGGSIQLDATVESVAISGGKFTGFLDSIHAGQGASVALTATAGVSAKAKGSFKAAGIADVFLHGGSSAGAEDLVSVTQGKAKASLTADASIGIIAGSASFTGLDVTFGAGGHGAFETQVHATGAATAVLKDSSVIDVAVTRGLTVTAGAGDFTVRDALTDNGNSAEALAAGPGAAASLTADGSVTLKAGGALAVDAGSIAIGTFGVNEALGASARASKAGKATYLEDNAIALSAGKGGLSLLAAGKLTIGVAPGIGIGNGDVIAASSSGAAGLTVEAGVSLAATGAVSLTAGSRLLIAADDSIGENLQITAMGAGAKATGTVEGNVTITGSSLTLTDVNARVEIERGSSVGKDLSVLAEGHGAAASATVEAGVSIAVSGNLTVNDGTNGVVSIGAQHSSHGSVAKGDQVTAGFGGAATGSVLTNVSLSGGTVTLTARTVSLDAENSIGLGGGISVGAKATAKLTDAGNTTLTAKGNLTVDALGLSVGAGGEVGSQARLKASSSGAVGSFIAQASAGIAAGGNVVLGTTLAGINLGVTAADKAGKETNLGMQEGTVTATIGGQASITAGGSLKVDFLALNLGAGLDEGSGMQGSVAHSKATLNINTGAKLTAGGSLTLAQVGSGSVNFKVGGHNGARGAISSGANIVTMGVATTKIAIDSSITVKAGGKLTLSDISTLNLSIASFSTPLEFANEAGGIATAIIDNNINITAKSVVASPAIPSVVPTSVATFTGGGVTETGTINVTGGIGKLDFSPLSVLPQGVQLTSEASGLGTLQQDASVISLVPILSAPQAAAAPAATLFTPQAGGVNIGTGDCQATLSHGCRSKD